MMTAAMIMPGCSDYSYDNPLDPGVALLSLSDLRVVMSEAAATLAWQDPNRYGTYPTSGYSYVVERSSDGAAYQEVGRCAIGTTTISVPGPYLATLQYRFRVHLAAGDRASPAAMQSGTLTFAAPSSLVLASMTESAALLQWQISNPYASTVVVERGTSPNSGFAIVDSVMLPATSRAVTGPYHADSTYYFRIYCKSAVNRSSYTSSVSNSLEFPSPSSLALTAISESAGDLRWDNANRSATMVVIERSTAQGSGFSPIDSVSSAQGSRRVVGPYHADSVYYFRVCNTSAVNRSGYSNVAFGAFAFPAPENLNVLPLAESFAELHWVLANPMATKVMIERAIGGADFVVVDSVGGNATIAMVGGPYRADMTYAFRVMAKSSYNASRYSNTASKTFEFPPPAQLRVTTLSAASATLKWQATNPFATKILIEISEGNESAYALVDSVPGSETTATVRRVFQSGIRYYFRLRASSSVNMSSASASVWRAFLETEWVSVPAGVFSYGSPAQTMTIGYSYDIMKYEVTNGQFVNYLNRALQLGVISVVDGEVRGPYPGDALWPAGTYPYYRLGTNPGGIEKYGQITFAGGTFHVTPDDSYLNHPVGFVSWFGAWAFADYHGLRLPTEQEWEKTARGNTGYDYPWGNAIWYSDANYLLSGDTFSEGTTPVGYYNGSMYGIFSTSDRSAPYGAYDMAGNVWEWTDSFYGASFPTVRVRRGGSWSDEPTYLRTWYREGRNIVYGYPTYIDKCSGFRCARTY